MFNLPRRMTRFIATFFGITSKYLVTVTAPEPDGGVRTATIAIDAIPWLHRENINRMVEVVQESGGFGDVRPNVIMIYKY